MEAFVPQTHKPGAEAEVDFRDVTVMVVARVGGVEATTAATLPRLIGV
ncbi:hypothetical protein ACFYT4_20480 [Streptomyces sp. NPDC004609]